MLSQEYYDSFNVAAKKSENFNATGGEDDCWFFVYGKKYFKSKEIVSLLLVLKYACYSNNFFSSSLSIYPFLSLSMLSKAVRAVTKLASSARLTRFFMHIYLNLFAQQQLRTFSSVTRSSRSYSIALSSNFLEWIKLNQSDFKTFCSVIRFFATGWSIFQMTSLASLDMSRQAFPLNFNSP